MKSGLKIGEKGVHDFSLTHLGLRMTGSNTIVACSSRVRMPCIRVERENYTKHKNGCNLPPCL